MTVAEKGLDSLHTQKDHRYLPENHSGKHQLKGRQVRKTWQAFWAPRG